MKRGYETTPIAQVKEKAYLVGVSLPDSSIAREREYLQELEQLASTAGAVVIGKTVQSRTRLDGATFIGPGKAQEIGEECKRLGANLLIFNSDLSPAQSRNLEKILNINVVDRTELILDIFASHAKTRQAKIQVELAQLTYTLPRLRKLWDHLSRQAGGIGTRGPGETQLEVDRRRIDARMSHLRKQLKKIEKRKNVIRSSREDFPIAAIVGYTNAGKSTLMNALTGSRVVVGDRLFATLDTTTRKMKSSTNGNARKPILLVDTVGFIRKLPHHLVESFKATLEDIAQATLYMHVVDVSHPAFLEQMEVADATLMSIDNPGVETLHIFNKIDKVDSDFINGMKRRYPEALFISASKRMGIEEVREKIERLFYGRTLRVQVILPATAGRSIAAAKEMIRDVEEGISDGKYVLEGLIDAASIKHLENLSQVELKYIPHGNIG